MKRPPVDQPIRDRVATTPDVSFALGASAGAGKTSVLVERVVSLLGAGADPARLAVITFTEKAAGEVAERVQDRLDQAQKEATGETKTILERALTRLPELCASTIHAFALELLRREAFEAGWSPRTEVIAEYLAASAIDEAYEGWRRGFDLRHPDLGVELRLAAAEQTIRAAALELLKYRDLTPVVSDETLDWNVQRVALTKITDDLEATRKLCKRPEEDKLLLGNRTLLSRLDRARTLGDEAAVRLILETGDNKSGGRKADWNDDGHLRFRALIEKLRGWRKETNDLRMGHLHRALITDLQAHFLPAVEAEKLERSQGDYDDLLFRCARMLKARTNARARLSRRFDAILVDEVQDTDPIQAEIALYLTRAPDLEGDWRAHPPRSGHLFAVGDPKQSIYRFRRADVATWRELSDLIAKDGEAQTLTQNFRSVPGIVAFANHVFEGLPNYQPIEAYRAAAELDPVVVLRTDKDNETDAAVRHIHDLLQQKKVRPKDIMILLPSWTHAEKTQDAFLAAGIDCVVDGGATFFNRDEVRLAVAATRALDEPTDAEAVVFVLRGLFGLSHDALAKHVAAGGTWSYTRPEQPAGPVAEALEQLRMRYREKGRRSMVELLDDLLDETRAPLVFSLTPRGRAMLANLDKVKELIRQLEAVTQSPSELVERFAALEALGDEQDLPVADSDADAVKITTLFKAKGLEAPVVVILHARRNASTPQAIVDREAGTVAIKAKEIRPPDYEARAAAEKEAQLDEMRRWMYVAATRARDQLVICHTDSSTLLSQDLQRGLQGIESVPHDAVKPIAEGVTVRVRDPAELQQPPAVGETFPGLDPVIDALLETRPDAEDRALAERTEACRRAVDAGLAASTRWLSVTQAVKPVRFTHGGGVGMLGGTVVHRVMERLDLKKPREALLAEVAGLVDAEAKLAGLDEQTAVRCEEVTRQLLHHEVVDRARTAPEHWKEVPFAYEEDGAVINGIIDLCFPLASDRRQWVVVDWKSNLPPKGTPEHQAYQRQIGIYAQALIETMVGHAIEVVDRVVAGPHPTLLPDPWEVALESVRDELREGLAELMEEGRPAPLVGRALDGATFELLWEGEGVGLMIDQPAAAEARAQGAGLRVLPVQTVAPGWDRYVFVDLARLLDESAG